MEGIFWSFLCFLVSISEEIGQRGQQVCLVGQESISFNLCIYLHVRQFLNNMLPLPLSPEEAHLIKGGRRFQVLHQREPDAPLQDLPDHWMVVPSGIRVKLEARQAGLLHQRLALSRWMLSMTGNLMARLSPAALNFFSTNLAISYLEYPRLLHMALHLVLRAFATQRGTRPKYKLLSYYIIHKLVCSDPHEHQEVLGLQKGTHVTIALLQEFLREATASCKLLYLQICIIIANDCALGAHGEHHQLVVDVDAVVERFDSVPAAGTRLIAQVYGLLHDRLRLLGR